MNPLKVLGTSLRALFAAVVAFGTGLSAVLVGDVGIGALTDGQWVTIGLGALIAFGGVWGIVNVKANA